MGKSINLQYRETNDQRILIMNMAMMCLNILMVMNLMLALQGDLSTWYSINGVVGSNFCWVTLWKCVDTSTAGQRSPLDIQ